MSFISAPAVNPGSQMYLIGTTSRVLTANDDGKIFKFSGVLGTYDVSFDETSMANLINTGRGFYARFSFEGNTALRTTIPSGWVYSTGASSGSGPSVQTVSPANSGASWGISVQMSGANMAVNIQSYLSGGLTSSGSLLMTANNRLTIIPISVATANAGGGAAVPATVAGFIQCQIDGTTRKIPYFAN